MANMRYEKNDEVIEFDDFEDNTEEYGSYWVEMCPACFQKYKHLIDGKQDDGGTACGICSVKGCQNEADYYVDFAKDEVSFTDGGNADDETL